MGDHFTFNTEAGPLDCLGIPDGTSGYADLRSRAAEYELDGIPVDVVSLADLMRLKRAAGRLKDRVELEILEALRQEIEASPSSG